MDDGVDSMFCNQRGHARLVASVTNYERRIPSHRPVEAGGEIVEHHRPLADVDERMNHVAADIAGAASDQDRHAAGPLGSTAIAPAPAVTPDGARQAIDGRRRCSTAASIKSRTSSPLTPLAVARKLMASRLQQSSAKATAPGPRPYNRGDRRATTPQAGQRLLSHVCRRARRPSWLQYGTT